MSGIKIIQSIAFIATVAVSYYFLTQIVEPYVIHKACEHLVKCEVVE